MNGQKTTDSLFLYLIIFGGLFIIIIPFALYHLDAEKFYINLFKRLIFYSKKAIKTKNFSRALILTGLFIPTIIYPFTQKPSHIYLHNKNLTSKGLLGYESIPGNLLLIINKGNCLGFVVHDQGVPKTTYRFNNKPLKLFEIGDSLYENTKYIKYKYIAALGIIIVFTGTAGIFLCPSANTRHNPINGL